MKQSIYNTEFNSILIGKHMKRASDVPVHQESNIYIRHKILCPDTASDSEWGLRTWQQKLGNFGHASTALLILTSLQWGGNESCKEQQRIADTSKMEEWMFLHNQTSISLSEKLLFMK